MGVYSRVPEGQKKPIPDKSFRYQAESWEKPRRGVATYWGYLGL